MSNSNAGVSRVFRQFTGQEALEPVLEIVDETTELDEVVELIPGSDWTKQEIVDWLVEREVDASMDSTKAKLLEQVKVELEIETTE